MQENLKEDIIIRDMQESDVSWIILSAKEQGKSLDVEKFYSRLEEQSKGKNFALIAEYKGEIAGYVYVYPFSKTGLFKNEDYAEIVDLTAFKKYQDLGVENKLMDAAEKIASNYSDITYLSVNVHDWKALNMCFQRGFIPHKSGIEYACNDLNDRNEDELVFGLYKVDKTNFHRFSIINTLERPYLRWLQEGVKTALAAVNTEKCQRIQIGNEITLTDRQNISYVKGVVIFRHEYDTIREMLQSEGVKNICPFLNDDDLEKAVQMYQNLPEFFGAKKYRCVAFGLQIVESKL